MKLMQQRQAFRLTCVLACLALLRQLLILKLPVPAEMSHPPLVGF